MKRKIIIGILFIASFICIPFGVNAKEEVIGSITIDGKETEYTELNKFLRNLESLNGSNIEINLFKDINITNDDYMMHFMGLSVSENSNVILDLNGNSFNNENNGLDVFLMGNLTIKDGTINQLYISGSLNEKNMNITLVNVNSNDVTFRNSITTLKGNCNFDKIYMDSTGDSSVVNPSSNILNIDKDSNVVVKELTVHEWDMNDRPIRGDLVVNGNLKVDELILEEGPNGTGLEIGNTGILTVKNLTVSVTSNVNNNGILKCENNIVNNGIINNKGSITYKGTFTGNEAIGNKIEKLYAVDISKIDESLLDDIWYVAGNKVVLNIDKHYYIKDLVITDANGNKINAVDNTFIMPDSNVSITGVVEPIKYQISIKDNVISVNGGIDIIDNIVIDGKIVSKDNYIIDSENNTIIIKDSYLKNFDNGKYEVRVNFNNGTSAKNNMIIDNISKNIEVENPSTVDNILIYVSTFIISIFGLLFTIIYYKKKIRSINNF